MCSLPRPEMSVSRVFIGLIYQGQIKETQQGEAQTCDCTANTN